jgi:hypothetical protein
MRSAGVEPVRGRSAVLRRADLHPIGLLSLALAVIPALISHIKALRKVDLVWVNTIIVPLWLLAARLTRTPAVVHCHEIVGGSRVQRRIMYAPLHLANAVVLVSEACRRDIETVYPRLARRAQVVINRSFSFDRPIATNNPDALVMIGRLSARKGQDVLLAALELMPSDGPIPVVHVCGDAFPSRAGLAFESELRAAVARSRADIRLHGYMDRLDAYRLGGIVVVPSVDPEPCSLVVSEGITADRIIIASDCGGTPEQLAGCGLLVPPADPAALANKISGLLGDPTLRAGLRERTQARAQQLSVPDYFRRMDEIIEEVRPSHPSPR